MGFINKSFIDNQNNEELDFVSRAIMNKDETIPDNCICEKQLEEELNYSKECEIDMKNKDDNDTIYNVDDDLEYEVICSKFNNNGVYIFEEEGLIKDIEIYIPRYYDNNLFLDWFNNTSIFGNIIQDTRIINEFNIQNELMLNLIQGNNIIDDYFFKFKLTFIYCKKISTIKHAYNLFTNNSLKISIENINLSEWFIKYKFKKEYNISSNSICKYIKCSKYSKYSSINNFQNFGISFRVATLNNICNISFKNYTCFLILITDLYTVINSFELFSDLTKIYEQSEFEIIEYFNTKLHLIPFDSNIKNFDDVRENIENKKIKNNGIRSKKLMKAIINKDTYLSNYNKYIIIQNYTLFQVLEKYGEYIGDV